jgi:hypothetical protein
MFQVPCCEGLLGAIDAAKAKSRPQFGTGGDPQKRLGLLLPVFFGVRFTRFLTMGARM